jgi:copper chaperone CopZ
MATGLLSMSACGSAYGDFSKYPDRKSCEVAVSLPNMACAEACPVKVRSALSNVDGVRRVDVDYEGRVASITAEYPACSGAGHEQMIRNLYARGYKAKIVSSRPLMGFETP